MHRILFTLCRAATLTRNSTRSRWIDHIAPFARRAARREEFGWVSETQGLTQEAYIISKTIIVITWMAMGSWIDSICLWQGWLPKQFCVDTTLAIFCFLLLGRLHNHAFNIVCCGKCSTRCVYRVVRRRFEDG